MTRVEVLSSRGRDMQYLESYVKEVVESFLWAYKESVCVGVQRECYVRE